jgi:hypothetical protein
MFGADLAPTNCLCRGSAVDCRRLVALTPFDADDNQEEDTKQFIDRQVMPGQKRPPAPSLRRATGADQARPKTGL